VVREACSIYNLEEPLLRAVMEVESDYNRYAVSSAGARGLMQLMPETMVYVGVGNPWDPKQNIMGGAKYLKELIKRFSGDLPLALAAYNAGPNAVIKYGKVPPYPQTERYVMKVMDRYYRYTGFNN
jgi:soluble lytic murein transglycosylase-like protein